MCFDDLGLSGFQEGFLDFVEDVLSHDVIVELRVSFTVESEPSHLTFYLSFIGGITIILGSSADEFLDVFIMIYFGGEVP